MTARVGNYRCSHSVNECEEFNGSNIYARTEAPGVYVVYSYGSHFPMYACINGKWYANTDGYSRTTAKHKSQARPSATTIGVDTSTLKQLIRSAEPVAALAA